MPQTHARTLVALSTLAALSLAVSARSIAPAPPSPAAPPAASALASTHAPQLRHAQAAALLAQLRSDLVDVRTHLERMRVLAIKSSNGLLSPAERAVLDMAFQQQVLALSQLAQTSHWNGIPLLAGSTGLVELQIDPALPQLLLFMLPDCTPMSLGVTSVNIASVANAADAMASCDTALDNVFTMLSDLRAAALTLGL